MTVKEIVVRSDERRPDERRPDERKPDRRRPDGSLKELSYYY
jgi:hypothetical protein